VNPVNDAPVAVNDVYNVDEDATMAVEALGVLANDSDVDGNALSAVLVSGPAHGALTLNPDGSFAYTPDANFFGADSFVYRASDGTANSADATVSITVNAVNDAPVASADGPYLGIIGSPVTFDGSASSDVEGTALAYKWSFGDGATLVTASPNPTHAYAAAGIYTVTLVVSDGSLDSAPTTTSATIGDPIGSNRGDVDAFLSYAAPTARSVQLPAGTTSFDVTIIYGAAIIPATFAVELNGSSFVGFSPVAGRSQTVTIPLSPGRNTLAISVDGTLADGRTATDRDRLTFVVG
jgi:VCBS repeat-containing protein